MPFHISAELRYQVDQRSTMLLNLHALSTANQTLSNEVFTLTEGATCEFFPIQTGMNRYVRIDTGPLTNLLITYQVDAETNPGSRRIQAIDQIPIGRIQAEAIRYLFPSRYCQSDQFGQIAFDLFGQIIHPLAKASAISDWLFENLSYSPGCSDASTSACDTLNQRAGVCRDFAHLGIAFCRALSIPARYFTGYACNMQPPDFHACFEVCVGNQWFIFDPTRLSSPNGLIRIATGRDAADASLATIFGEVEMQSIAVSCTADYFKPMSHDELIGKAVLLEP